MCSFPAAFPSSHSSHGRRTSPEGLHLGPEERSEGCGQVGSAMPSTIGVGTVGAARACRDARGHYGNTRGGNEDIRGAYEDRRQRGSPESSLWAPGAGAGCSMWCAKSKNA